MKAVLIRIGVDHAYGDWNAPADPRDGQFVYVPIPEGKKTRFRPGCATDYGAVMPALQRFAADRDLDLQTDLKLPPGLDERALHLDPDFDNMTYGDDGARRGAIIRTMQSGDLLVFYAGLRPVTGGRLIYALIGQMVIDEIVNVVDVEADRRHENAHTRKSRLAPDDIVVRARRSESGLFSRYISIGEFRERAYRVKRDVLAAWGDLSVKNGYIQRSARPPHFLDPARFRAWLKRQSAALIPSNNWTVTISRVVVVHLRQPDMRNPKERRDDPFWEFGSFGCTGCHAANLLNPNRIGQLEGVRLAFAQGGPRGFKLVHLTPPVTVMRHKLGDEIRWSPIRMPFRYDAAPKLIDNEGDGDFSMLNMEIKGTNRGTWMGCFSSKFRSRCRPLTEQQSQEMINTFEDRVARASPVDFARRYEEALPIDPPLVDRRREETYRRRLSALDGKRRRCQ